METNERMTDQEAVCWVSRPLSDGKDMDEVLDKLIAAEKEIKVDYESLLSQDYIEQDHSKILKKHHQEADANLHYF